MTGFKTIYKFAILVAALLLGACSSSGIVSKDMNLSVVNVTVNETGEVDEGARFSHELREEVLYEFSKAERGENEAQIFLEVSEVTYKNLEENGYKQGKNQLVSYGRVVDVVTGDSMGEFPLKVIADNDDADIKSLLGRRHIQSELIRLLAHATLEKVYGRARANKISEKFAAYERQPYLIKVANPLQLSSLPQSVIQNLPDSVIVEVPTEEATGDMKPKVIDAPQLPVQ